MLMGYNIERGESVKFQYHVEKRCPKCKKKILILIRVNNNNPYPDGVEALEEWLPCCEFKVI